MVVGVEVAVWAADRRWQLMSTSWSGTTIKAGQVRPRCTTWWQNHCNFSPRWCKWLSVCEQAAPTSNQSLSNFPTSDACGSNFFVIYWVVQWYIMQIEDMVVVLWMQHLRTNERAAVFDCILDLLLVGVPHTTPHSIPRENSIFAWPWLEKKDGLIGGKTFSPPPSRHVRQWYLFNKICTPQDAGKGLFLWALVCLHVILANPFIYLTWCIASSISTGNSYCIMILKYLFFGSSSG